MAVSMHVLSRVHPDWLEVLDFKKANQILNILNKQPNSYAPNEHDVFNVFATSPYDVRVVMVGQDPYPTDGDAMGLAFSVNRSEKLPKSLQNIFKEIASDCGGQIRRNGNLRDWQRQGVFLVNRVLTVEIGRANSHTGIGWEEFTEGAISHLGSKGAVGLFMGKSAGAMSKYFQDYIEVAHPSPLSAHRGFFGSKVFSRVNSYLQDPIIWS